ncbi:MAG TPA: DUF5329 domain-containing protein [Ramlibacter sp.]|nr:DUF5329 domain-containing protein [Ramlibacter sp.]
MRFMRLFLATILFALATGALHAAPVQPPVKAEIDALIARLGTSGCSFNRNGTWYTAADAKTHLLRKLEYLEGKDLVKTTEQFIERGASSSSASGKPYLVKCGGTPVESRVWLSGELKKLRNR